MTASLALLVMGFVLFVLAAIGLTSGRANLMAAGCAAWVLAELVARV